MVRKLQPRSASNYDNREHGRRESSAPPDDKTVNQSLTRVNVVRPKWNGGPLTFRAFPALDPEKETPTPLPGRLGIEPREVNPFMVRVPVASFIGLDTQTAEKSTFILYEPWLAEEKRVGNPYRVFYFACKDAEKSGEFGNGRSWLGKWNKFMKGGKGRGAEISNPTARWYLQGYVLANDEKDYIAARDAPLGLGEEDETILIQLSVSAGDTLLDLMARQRPSDKIPNNITPESHPWRYLTYGDPTGVPNADGSAVSKGVIVTVFNPKKIKTITEHTSWNGEIKETGQGYEAALSTKWKSSNGEIVSSQLTDSALAKAKESWQFWFDDPGTGQKGLLRVPSIEEQCLMIAKGYKDVPELLEFAWSDHPEFMTDDVVGVLRSRRSAMVPDGEADTPSTQQPNTQTDASMAGGTGGFHDDDETASEPAATTSQPSAEVEDEEAFDSGTEAEASLEASDDAFGEDPDDFPDDDDFDEESEMASTVPSGDDATEAATTTEAATEEESDEFQDEDNFDEAPAAAASTAEAQMSEAMSTAKANAGKRTSAPPAAD